MRAILGIVGGYLGGAAVGFALVSAFSNNAHDKSLETVMTAAFVTGPIGALLGLAGLLMIGRGSRKGA